MRFLALILSLILAVACASDQKNASRMSTAELKLRQQQLIEQISQPVGFRLSGFHPGTEDHDSQVHEKNAIEFELLRRWKSGDREAYLPQFSR